VSNVANATGTVTSVGTVADTSSGVANYPVVVSFTDTSGGYSPGANVQVTIAYAQKQNVVEVPTLAVTTTADGSTVTVVNNGTKETRSITTGITSGGMVEVTSGLQPGEQVLLTLPNFAGITGRNGTSTGQAGTNFARRTTGAGA
jgi:multidrug efflux pump subunit AcrA (membrane-fusion protein)